MKCEECGKEAINTIMGACVDCADKIIKRIEKNVRYKKNLQDSEF